MVEITQLRATVDRHMTEFVSLRGIVGYLQLGL